MVGFSMLTWGSTENAVREYISHNNLTFPTGKDDGSARAYFGVREVPTVVAIQDGRMVWIGPASRATAQVLDGLLSTRTKPDSTSGL